MDMENCNEGIDDNLFDSYRLTGKKVAAEGVLYTMGRQGNTDTLNIGAVGITADNRGLLDVNAFYQVGRETRSWLSPSRFN